MFFSSFGLFALVCFCFLNYICECNKTPNQLAEPVVVQVAQNVSTTIEKKTKYKIILFFKLIFYEQVETKN